MVDYADSINFGEIDHFLYVRIMSLCADLGFTTKEFIEEGCGLFFGIVDLDGISRFEIIEKEYKLFLEENRKKELIPRMKEMHPFVVKGIKGEISEYLKCVKVERHFMWDWMLRILLMLVEIDRNKIDAPALEAWAEKENRQFIMNEFKDIRIEMAVKG